MSQAADLLIDPRPLSQRLKKMTISVTLVFLHLSSWNNKQQRNVYSQNFQKSAAVFFF